jgi:hypothetical protein
MFTSIHLGILVSTRLDYFTMEYFYNDLKFLYFLIVFFLNEKLDIFWKNVILSMQLMYLEIFTMDFLDSPLLSCKIFETNFHE